MAADAAAPAPKAVKPATALDLALALKDAVIAEFDAEKGSSVHQEQASRKIDAVIVMLKGHNDKVAADAAAKIQGASAPQPMVSATVRA